MAKKKDVIEDVMEDMEPIARVQLEEARKRERAEGLIREAEERFGIAPEQREDD